MQGTKPYTILFKRHWVEIFAYCNKKMHGDSDAANDMAEFAFIKLWDNFETIQNDAHGKRFLFVAAKNACYNELARIQRQRAVSIESVPALEDTLIEEPLWDYDMINAEIMAFINTEIENLPPMCKKVVKLFIQGINSKEVGKRLHITQKTALNQKLTGISKIKERLKLRYG
jgi:RNA polymerase sigma factor (sigma-70 family)